MLSRGRPRFAAALAVLALGAAALVGAQQSAASAGGDPSRSVWVTIPPQHWVVERLAGSLVTVHVLIEPGQSHETYEPTPKQIAGLEAADLYVRLGVPFEAPILARLADLAPTLPIVDGGAGITVVPMEAPLLGDRGAEPRTGQPDPHYWLDPKLLELHAATTSAALSRLLPEHAAELAANLDALRADLDAADRRIATLLAPYAGQAVVVYHPAFGYFLRRYHLVQLAAEVEGREPAARQLADLIDSARSAGVRVVFVQPQYSGRSPQALAEAIGARLVVLDPLAEDVPSNLETVAQRIASALRPSP